MFDAAFRASAVRAKSVEHRRTGRTTRFRPELTLRHDVSMERVLGVDRDPQRHLPVAAVPSDSMADPVLRVRRELVSERGFKAIEGGLEALTGSKECTRPIEEPSLAVSHVRSKTHRVAEDGVPKIADPREAFPEIGDGRGVDVTVMEGIPQQRKQFGAGLAWQRPDCLACVVEQRRGVRVFVEVTAEVLASGLGKLRQGNCSRPPIG